jgi:hypothetical protein
MQPVSPRLRGRFYCELIYSEWAKTSVGIGKCERGMSRTRGRAWLTSCFDVRARAADSQAAET